MQELPLHLPGGFSPCPKSFHRHGVHSHPPPSPLQRRACPWTSWAAAPKPRPLSDHSISAHLFNSPPHAQDLPLDKLGGFGGKLGEALRGLGCATAGQVCTRVLEMLTFADII